MDLLIAIQPDQVIHKNGEIQSYSKRWGERAAAEGVRVEPFDAYRTGAIKELSRYDGFMWRFPPDADVCRFAHVFLNAAEHGLGMCVFPNWNTRWHMEDKIAQSYALEALGVPTPRTRIIWQYDEAMEYVRTVKYPQILKLASGYQSSNVRLLRDAEEAAYFVDRLFMQGLSTLAYGPVNASREILRKARYAVRCLRSGDRSRTPPDKVWHQDYLYMQEFVSDNDYDTRVTVIGDRAFAFVRHNRENDFRASGSGLIDWDPDRIAPQNIEMAFRVAADLGTQAVAIDTLQRSSGEIVVLELTLTFASWAVAQCPGHWRLLSRDPYDTEWVSGAMRPEDAIWEDFVTRIRRY